MNEIITASADKKDHPGVYVPPPLLYVIVFLSGIALQKYYPLPSAFFGSATANILSGIFIALAVLLLMSSIRQFIVSKNTLIPIKPATSLQTTGIYAITRNPMYTGLLALYIGITFIAGSWWDFILLPLLVVVVQVFVIKKEEKYLERKFGDTYTRYRRKVRRWI
jgi:protein-S-isoprenylcysteine O-methyltransferase Ste14